jgi:hypothetical protein
LTSNRCPDSHADEQQGNNLTGFAGYTWQHRTPIYEDL